MIKIVCGVYGYYNGNKVERKDVNSAPFSTTPEEEKRLVEKGIAEYVGATPAYEAPAASTADIPEYSEESSAKELWEIAKEAGLTFKVGMSKAEMVAELNEHFLTAETEDELEEDAPTFDATAAVVE